MFPEKFVKTCSSYCTLIGDLTGLLSAHPPPPPKVLERIWTLYLLYLYVHFRRAFVEFVVLKTKIRIITVTAKCWGGAVLPTPPPRFTPRHMIDASYVVLFYNYLYWQCIVVLKTQLIKIIISHFGEKFEIFCKFPLKMCIFCNIYLVDKVYN